MATLLASPLSQISVTTFSTEENGQYRPAKNIEAFNSLLPPAVEFVEGSSTGVLAVAQGKYEPINSSPKLRAAEGDSTKANTSVLSTTSLKPAATKTSPAKTPTKTPPSLYSRPIETSWPSGMSVGAGFFNTGNTCFLNSALQCLLHTPPLIRVLMTHTKSSCHVKGSNFCMSCSMQQLIKDSFQHSRAMTPSSITRNMHSIAKHMKKGRQEDSHEFIRYAIDALQKSCLAGFPQKIDHKLAETTWVHKIFGGQLRSRVTCGQCGHNSDTFDSILDLSLDIHNALSVKDSLKKFTAVDTLRGSNKYKCEKCKRAVNAEKKFTIHNAPLVLTVHLKRFSPLGRKIAHSIPYDDRLNLQVAMSEGQYGPTYSLYGVISHAGSGPNSGHYYAHVKGGNGQWYEMNDDLVERVPRVPVSLKNAYILFYVQEKGQSLEAVVNGSSFYSKLASTNGVSKKRRVVQSDEEEGEDVGEQVDKSQPFIGPVLPKRISNGTSSINGMQPKKPINGLQQKKSALVDYEDEDGDVDKGEPVNRMVANTPSPSENQSSPVRQPPTSSAPPSSPDGAQGKKRKSPNQDESYHSEDVKPSKKSNGFTPTSTSTPPPKRNTTTAGGNPFNRIKGNNNFDDDKSKEDFLFRPRKLTKQYKNQRRRPLM